MSDLKNKVVGCAKVGVGLFFVTNLVLVIVIGMFVNRSTGRVDADDMAKYMPIEISRVRASQQEVTSTLARGWKTEPFIDVIVMDSTLDTAGCPADFPDEVVYDIWPGTMQMCDCMQRKEERKIDIGTECVDKKT